VEKADLTQTQMNGVMISKFKSFDIEFTKVDVILEKSNAIDVQTSTIKAGQEEIKNRQNNIDRSTNEIKYSIGVDDDGATKDSCSTLIKWRGFTNLWLPRLVRTKLCVCKRKFYYIKETKISIDDAKKYCQTAFGSELVGRLYEPKD
jgi:hypothetical protein